MKLEFNVNRRELEETQYSSTDVANLTGNTFAEPILTEVGGLDLFEKFNGVDPRLNPVLSLPESEPLQLPVDNPYIDLSGDLNSNPNSDLPLFPEGQYGGGYEDPVIAGRKRKKKSGAGAPPAGGTASTTNSTAPGNSVGQTGLPPVPGNMKSPSGQYVIAYYADTDGIGHGFLKIRPYEQPDAWTGFGFYPEDNNFGVAPVYVNGDVDQDSTHEWNSKVCFLITEDQLRQVLAKANEWEDKSYVLTGPTAQNCVSFVEDVSNTIGTPLPDGIDEPNNLNTRIEGIPQHINNPKGTTSTTELRERSDQIIDARR